METSHQREICVKDACSIPTCFFQCFIGFFSGNGEHETCIWIWFGDSFHVFYYSRSADSLQPWHYRVVRSPGDANLKLNAGTKNMVMTATSPPSSFLNIATRVVINVGDKKFGHKWLGYTLAAFGAKNQTLDLDCSLQGGRWPVFEFVLSRNVSYQDHGRHLVSSMLWNWTMEHLEH